MAATALWVAAKLEEVKEVREHPRKLIEMVMVAVDRCITRREAPEGRKLAVLDSHSKVRGGSVSTQHGAAADVGCRTAVLPASPGAQRPSAVLAC
jgi:hypothetical protein